MDYAVRLQDVGDRDARDIALGVGDGQMRLAAALKGEGRALNGLERQLAATFVNLGGDIGGGQPAGNDVIGQDRSQFVLVLGLQQRLDRALRQRGESFVGRRE